MNSHALQAKTYNMLALFVFSLLSTFFASVPYSALTVLFARQLSSATLP